MSGVIVASSRPVTLRLDPACDLTEVRAAVRTTRDFLSQQGWDDPELGGIELALVEACNNAVKYATTGGRLQPVTLETDLEPARVEFRVRDHTPGFTWPAEVDLPVVESERGRGLYLITSLMDYVSYFRGAGENILVMRKSRPGALREVPPPASTEEWTRKLAEGEEVITEMLEELSSCYESLAAIFRYSNEQSRAGSLKDFATRLFNDLLQIVSAEWYVLRLTARLDPQLAVLAASDPALELPPLALEGPAKPADSLEVEAALTRQSVWFGVGNRLRPDGPLLHARPGAVGIIHPIFTGTEMMGTLALGRRPRATTVHVRGEGVFTAAQTNVVSTFCDFMAVQIANTRFQEEQVKRRLVVRDLEIARRIQRSLLPVVVPQVPGYSLAAFYRSALEVGGDFYDAIKVDENSVLLAIADVMGKGVPAALFAAILRSLLRATPELTCQPSALMTRVNRLLYAELSEVDMFITALLVFIDVRARKIVVASAGHCPLALADARGVRTFSPEGMPLGIVEDGVYPEETVDLPKGCRLLLFTDGLTEGFNPRREQFGHERLMEWLARAPASHASAGQLKDDLIRELDQYRGNTALNDDQTFLIMSG